MTVVDGEYARLIEEAEHAHAPRLTELAQAAKDGTLAALAEAIPTVEEQIAENE